MRQAVHRIGRPRGLGAQHMGRPPGGSVSRASWRVAAIAVSLVLALVPERAASQWPMFRGGPTHPGEVETAGVRALGGLRWELKIDGPVRSSAAVEGGSVYVGAGDGLLRAVDLTTGEVLWRYDAGAPISSSPAVAGGSVFVQDDRGRIHAVDRARGAGTWKRETGPVIPFPWGLEGWDYLTSSPVVVDDVVLVGSGDGVLRALDVDDGSDLWSHATGGRIRSTPAVGHGAVYVGSADGHLHAVDLASGDLRWRFRTRGVDLDAREHGFDRRTIQSSPTVVADAIYFGSRDANLYKLDERGRELWSRSEGTSWVVSTPAVAGDLVYAGLSSARRFDARDAATGELRYSVDLGGLVLSSPIVVEETVYIAGEGGQLLALEADRGDVRWRYRMRAGSYASPVVADGVVIIGDEAGYLYALEAARDAPPRRAVYWDESLRDASSLGRAEGHRAILDHFGRHGYDVLDGQDLAGFLAGRIRDGAPSVVVFAMDALPEAVAGSPEPRGLLRDYLASGGKVVWLGMPPFFFAPNGTGGLRVDRDAPSRFLGVDHGTFNTDSHVHRPTPVGEAWGLEGWWTGWRGVRPEEVSDVLALDDEGLAAAWVKRFGGRPGTGFVRLQPSTDPTRLEAIRAVAEYGVFRRP